MDKVLFSFGHGYSARALARRLLPQGWRIYGTTRSPARAEAIRATGVIPVLSETPGGVRNAGPARPGQHNAEVYGDLLGLGADEIADLETRGVL